MRVDPWPKGTIGTPCGPGGLNCEIYVVNVDGSGKTNLSRNSAIDGYPDWSPDGRRIVFNREVYRGGHEIVDLVTTNPDGTGLTQLTLAPLGGGVPRWSPDGSRIVFQFEGEEETLDIFMINADGSNRVNLTRNPSGNDWYASW
jgi:Tol biopolymer transport system component